MDGEDHSTINRPIDSRFAAAIARALGAERDLRGVPVRLRVSDDEIELPDIVVSAALAGEAIGGTGIFDCEATISVRCQGEETAASQAEVYLGAVLMAVSGWFQGGDLSWMGDAPLRVYGLRHDTVRTERLEEEGVRVLSVSFVAVIAAGE